GLEKFLEVLPTVATSPYAFVAYVVLILSWLVVALKVKRNKELLKNLDKLPEQDRLPAFKLELQGVEIKEGLSPEQWIKSNTHRYLFIGFLAICLVVTTLTTLSIAHTPRISDNVEMDISLYKENGKPLSDDLNGKEIESSNAITEDTASLKEKIERTRTFLQNELSKSDSLNNINKKDSQLMSEEKSTDEIENHTTETTISLYHEIDSMINDSIRSESELLKRLASAMSSNKLEYPSYDFRMSFSGFISDPEFDDLKLSYGSKITGNQLQITPTMPYLESIKNGTPLIGFRYWNKPFQWEFPKMSLKMVNNTLNTIFLNKIIIYVEESNINNSPVPIFKEDFWSPGEIVVINEGFGKIVNPKVDYKILDSKTAIHDDNYDILPFSDSLKDSKDHLTFSIVENLSKELLDQLTLPVVCVMGRMSYYSESQVYHEVKFKTRVALRMAPPGVPAPPNYQYDIFFESGRENYSEIVDISQSIKPGEIDHFLLMFATDKSAEFKLRIKVLSVSGEEFSLNHVTVNTFVPKSESEDIAREYR
ncbi:MAG: hypothetical protein RJQ14_15690, partial [Marinoscillum sp.]